VKNGLFKVIEQGIVKEKIPKVQPGKGAGLFNVIRKEPRRNEKE
jgi:hypothetical protein